MRVGDMAAATGVSPRLLRYYEEQGLLAPERSAAGQRLYAADDVERVARIRRLLDAGLSTTVIAQILACVCGGTGDVEPCLDPMLQEELARIDAKLAQLAEHRGRLEAIIEREEGTRSSGGTRRDPALLLASKR
ncbi:MerR family transcriptional regulator [Phytoactinopolyspora halotolerans]|uniref:MerR family transcriptional regulator n=1 Tax=Phytoactinopolyspora halotolerans TaxID=1981512 RepID=A0A6L9S7F6_9ACTN|nr:MerR family transcriptional regulator [Phytoactinopolyspora halotolerans]